MDMNVGPHKTERTSWERQVKENTRLVHFHFCKHSAQGVKVHDSLIGGVALRRLYRWLASTLASTGSGTAVVVVVGGKSEQDCATGIAGRMTAVVEAVEAVEAVGPAEPSVLMLELNSFRIGAIGGKFMLDKGMAPDPRCSGSDPPMAADAAWWWCWSSSTSSKRRLTN